MKKVLIALAVCLLAVILLWPESELTIRQVETGNTLKLSNGTIVRLLGVSPTEEAKQQLEQYCNKKVELVHDKYSFNVKNLEDPDRNGRTLVVDAYVRVIDRKRVSVNAELLKSGSTMLVENIYDSLHNFRKYAEEGKARRGGDTPEVVSVVDYEEDDIILDPYEPSKDRKHSAWYYDGSKNLDMLEEACDFNLPYTKKFANELAARKPGPFNPGQICEIYAYCFQKWSYVNDPIDSEYVAKASETINCSLVGDCDDFAVLMASCMLAIGGRPCINTGTNTAGEGHAFTEIDISQFNESDVLAAVRECFPAYNITKLNCRKDGEYVWMNLDWMTPYPGGEYYDCSQARESYPYINGQWEWRHLN